MKLKSLAGVILGKTGRVTWITPGHKTPDKILPHSLEGWVWEPQNLEVPKKSSNQTLCQTNRIFLPGTEVSWQDLHIKIWLDIRKHHKEIIDKCGPGCSRARTAFIVRNEMFPGISVHKRHNSHHQLPSPQKVRSEPWGNSGRKEYLSSKKPPDCSHSLQWVPRKLGRQKHRLLTSASWGDVKGMISVSPKSCVFPYIGFQVAWW